MSILDTATADIESIFSKVDVPALISAAQSLVAAWPTVEPEVVEAAGQVPGLVVAIEKALTGGTPTTTDWAALDATLDANDAEIAAQGAAAQAEIDKENE